MTTQTGQQSAGDLGSAQADAILAAYNTAHRALVDLSNLIHGVVKPNPSTPVTRDAAIYCAYSLTIPDPRPDGPAAPLDDSSADRLILTAVDVHTQLSLLAELGGDVPEEIAA